MLTLQSPKDREMTTLYSYNNNSNNKMKIKEGHLSKEASMNKTIAKSKELYSICNNCSKTNSSNSSLQTQLQEDPIQRVYDLSVCRLYLMTLQLWIAYRILVLEDRIVKMSQASILSLQRQMQCDCVTSLLAANATVASLKICALIALVPSIRLRKITCQAWIEC